VYCLSFLSAPTAHSMESSWLVQWAHAEIRALPISTVSHWKFLSVLPISWPSWMYSSHSFSALSGACQQFSAAWAQAEIQVVKEIQLGFTLPSSLPTQNCWTMLCKIFSAHSAASPVCSTPSHCAYASRIIEYICVFGPINAASCCLLCLPAFVQC
jgi:hypothetical protein